MRRFITLRYLACCLLLAGIASLAAAQGQTGVRFEPTNFDRMYELYLYNRDHGRDTLVTTDSVLHTTHLLFDFTLRAAEIQHLDMNLRELTQAMMTRMAEHQMDEARKRYFMAPPPFGYARAAAYFGVAQRLLNPDATVIDDIAPLVDREVALIRAHAGRQVSPVMGVMEDYSQYVPRGHYTRNETFRRFFLAMMWYGRAGFPISGEKSPGVKLTRDEARANAWVGIMLARNLDDTPLYRRPDSPTPLGLWTSIYRPTQFIVGESDDLTPPEYVALTKEIFGDTLPGGWTKDAQEKTDAFIARAMALRPPRILGTVQTDRETAPPVALRLLGQRFTPDSDVFQRLVHPRVRDRYMPSGLDVMAALGSNRALAWQQQLGITGKFPGYANQLNDLMAELNGFDEAAWAKTAYLLWLRALKDLLAAPGTGDAAGAKPVYPEWVASPAWQDKQLNAALGSWAELRHDTILYVKQSYTVLATAMPMPARGTAVYVEPSTQVYADLITLIKTLRETLTAQGVFPAELAPNFRQFQNLLEGLHLQSAMDLHPGRAYDLTQEGWENLRMVSRIGEVLQDVETLPEPLRGALTGTEDMRMAVIADVHADLNTQRVLEVGVGRVMAVVVPARIDGKVVQACGPVFTYYEFAQPVDQRLTDAAWQDMLGGNRAGTPFILGRYLKR